ncbi:Leucine_rich repeats-containing protein [Hexamita inflata]|uniref:Leucine rich repeats-containing protein n=1 Tax=Hexamita inflata TaxID=28002 RepID=A0AA86TX88_9EUKA|nr:Leucine rich repeats-containing protein [Hexamita inflata]CAI9971831.1 Leucine rich repeats-containing protein [Hexamita inflata]
MSSEELKLVNTQAYYEEQFSNTNQYKAKSPFDDLVPPKAPVINAKILNTLSKIQTVELTLVNNFYQLDLSRLSTLKELTIKGNYSPQIYFGPTKYSIQKMTVNYPLETASSILLSDIPFEETQLIMEINEQSTEITTHAKLLVEKHSWNIQELNMNSCNLFVMDSSFLLLQHIKTLNISQNNICRLQYLWNSKRLTTLDCSYNNISSLQHLKNNINYVQSLMLRGNRIEQCEYLTMFNQLVKLDLSDNLIKSEEEVEFLSYLDNLRQLFINGNPVAVSRKRLIQLLYQEKSKLNNLALEGQLVGENEIKDYKPKIIINQLSNIKKQQLKRYFGASRFSTDTKAQLQECAQISQTTGMDQFGLTQVKGKTEFQQYINQRMVKELQQIQTQLDKTQQPNTVIDATQEKQLIKQFYQCTQTDIVMQKNSNDQNIISTRPSPLHPFGISVPHPKMSNLDIKEQSMPFFSKKYYQEISDDLKFRTNYKIQQSILNQKLTQTQQTQLRKHLVYPVQQVKAIDYQQEKNVMYQEEMFSRVFKQLNGIESKFDKQLDITGNKYIIDKKPYFIPDYVKNVSNQLEAIKILTTMIGLHNFIDIKCFTQLNEYIQSLVIRKLAQVIKVVPIDLQIVLMYDFFQKILYQLGLQDSISKCVDQQNIINLNNQEYKAIADKLLQQRRQLYENINIPADNPIYQIIQYIMENKLFERKLSGQVIQKEEENQLLGVKVYNDYKIYKYYNQNSGKIVYIKRQLNELNEEIGEELSDFDEENFDLQVTEKVQEEKQQQDFSSELYKPDQKELIKELNVCIPHGAKQVFLEMRKLTINVSTGLLQETNDQGQIVNTENLQNLVCYVMPKSSIIDKVYTCVVLLWSPSQL